MDAAELPFLLVFKIAAIAPLKNLDCQAVGAGLDVLGDVEFSGETAALTVGDFAAVEIEIEGRGNAAEMKDEGVVFPFFGDFEVAVVGADRVVAIDFRWT